MLVDNKNPSAVFPSSTATSCAAKIHVIYMHTPKQNGVPYLATIFSLSVPHYHVRNRSWKCFSALKSLGFSISILVHEVNRSGRRVQTSTCYFHTCTAKVAPGDLSNSVSWSFAVNFCISLDVFLFSVFSTFFLLDSTFEAVVF